MKLSNKGIALIKSFEGLRLNAYKDVAGIWTIGYGSTHYQDGRAVRSGDTLIDQTAADTLFAITLNKYVEAVNKGVKVALTQTQFDALVSFVYNVGAGVVNTSTLFKKLNAGDYKGAADQFLLWNKITDPKTGKKAPCKTLTLRRGQERALFLTA